MTKKILIGLGIACVTLGASSSFARQLIEVDAYSTFGTPAPLLMGKILDFNANLIREDLLKEFHVGKRIADQENGYLYCVEVRDDSSAPESFQNVLNRFNGFRKDFLETIKNSPKDGLMDRMRFDYKVVDSCSF